MDRPDALPDQMRLTLTPFLTSGNDVLHAEELSKSYGGQRIFRNVSFDVKRSDKVAIIGPNGGWEIHAVSDASEGGADGQRSDRFGTNVFIGYYDQEQAKLDESKTIFEEIADTLPHRRRGKSAICLPPSYSRGMMYSSRFPHFPAAKGARFSGENHAF